MRKNEPPITGWMPINTPDRPHAENVTWRALGTPRPQSPEAASPYRGRFTRPESVSVPARETIHLVMDPDETPIVVSRRGADGVLSLRRPPANSAMDLHKGSPVVSINLPKGDAAIIGPNLEDPEDRDKRRVHRCMDRLTVSYDEAGETTAFALADGVSQGAGSACIADAATRRAVDAQERLAADLNETGRRPTEEDGINLIRDVEMYLREQLPDLATLRNEYCSNYLPERAFTKQVRENMARMAPAQKIVGATTLITGSFRKMRNRESGETHEMAIVTQVGDGGCVVIGPGTRTAQGNFDERAPAQISPAKTKGVDEARIWTTAIPLKKDQILLVFSDGLQKSPRFPSVEAVSQRAQELFDQGITDPQDIVDQLLVDARGDGETWADDVSIFAHSARV